MKATEPVKEHGKNTKRLDNPTNIKSLSGKGGTSIEYRAAKLKRDHPIIAKRLEEGEFKNVADAERAAGVKPPRRVLVGKFSLFDDTYGPTEFAATLKERLTPEQYSELFRSE